LTNPNLHLERNFPIVALTGGPRSGKTSILSILNQWLSDLGCTVIIVPEVATELILAGLGHEKNWQSEIEFQRQVLLCIIEKENRYINAALQLRSGKIVIICDRGTMDGQAYIGKQKFSKLLNDMGLDIVEMRDRRYDAIIHLKTSAYGSRRDYKKKDNPARRENPAQAKKIDQKTLDSWQGCLHLKVIEYNSDFEAKIEKIKACLARILGIPVPLEIENKYLVKKPDLRRFPRSATAVSITQQYLFSGEPRAEERIRKRGQNGYAIYFHTIKKPYKRGQRLETERQISERDFLRLLDKTDSNFCVIEKERTCFTWRNQYFEFDSFKQPDPGLYLLEIELTEENDQVEIPPFIEVIKDVTDDPEYSNKEIARIK